MTFATESHRAMGSFDEAVREWNRRAREDGWRSSYAPTLACPACDHKGAILSTIFGTTKAACGDETCRYMWEIA